MSSETTTRIVTLDELRANKTKEKFFVLLHGKVYNVTNFIDEHPGGDEVLLAEGGQDATEAFEDVGHSDEARELLPAMFVGEFEKSPDIKVTSGPAADPPRVRNLVEQGSNMMYILPLGVLGAYFAYRFYTTGSI